MRCESVEMVGGGYPGEHTKDDQQEGKDKLGNKDVDARRPTRWDKEQKKSPAGW